MPININETYLVRYATVVATLGDGQQMEFRVYPDQGGTVYHFVDLDDGSQPVMMLANPLEFGEADLDVVRAVGLAMLKAYSV